MRYRVTFAVGFAAGFIAGARAGHERYEQIKKVARSAMENPAVQQAAGALRGQAGDLAQTARHKVSDKLHDKVPGMRGSADSNGEASFPPSGAPEAPPVRH
jgi:hypothetical protein